MQYKIYWKRVSQDNYLYGSSLFMKGKQVLFENALMPPSLVIQEWRSLSSYHVRKRQADLPLLKMGLTYQISSHLQVKPLGSLYLKIEFYDRFNQLLDFTILKDLKGEFTYPKKAYSYRIQLINAGCHSLNFDHLLLESC